MTHGERLARRLGKSLRIRLAALLLAVVALPAVFAELIASDLPVVVVGGDDGLLVPAVHLPARLRDLDRAALAARWQGRPTLWPLLRHGPNARAAAALPLGSAGHPLGTDSSGRDVLALLVYGARSALGLTLLALFASTLIGGVLGTLAGYAGGFWDALVSRPVELCGTFPTIVVVAVAMAIDPGRSGWSLCLAVTITRWAEVARLVRTEVARAATQDYVLAARALGSGDLGILRRHVLPQAARPLLVSTMFGVASLVLLEVAVSFVGIGLEGSWGRMIAEGLLPAGSLAATACATLVLAVTVGAAYLLAEATGEALDARVAARCPERSLASRR